MSCASPTSQKSAFTKALLRSLQLRKVIIRCKKILSHRLKHGNKKGSECAALSPRISQFNSLISVIALRSFGNSSRRGILTLAALESRPLKSYQYPAFEELLAQPVTSITPRTIVCC